MIQVAVGIYEYSIWIGAAYLVYAALESWARR